jgi:hypothetical protein
MVGILVHGNNHFILSGPLPDEATALALARYWSIIQIGEAKSSSFGQWEMRSREFRENLEWAVIVPGDREVSPGVARLLGELSTRGVDIRKVRGNYAPLFRGPVSDVFGSYALTPGGYLHVCGRGSRDA